MNPALPPLNSPENLRIHALHDAVYGPSTPANWEACRDHWLLAAATHWLEEEVAKDQAAAHAAALSQVAAQPGPR